MKKSILALGAHSDDVDLRVGGTFSKFKKLGYTVHYVVVTTSASGIPGLSANDAFPIRQQEAVNAAKLYGTEPVFLNFKKTVNEEPSDKLPVGPYIATALRDGKAINILETFIKENDPEIIFTHNPNDLHEDHYHTSAIVYTAFMNVRKDINARLLMWETGSKGRIIDFIPNTFISIDDEDVHIKDRAIKTHTSQYQICPWFENFAKENATYWGNKSSNQFAEAFIEIT